jgi:predicted O-methyltransferase YrrM
VNKDIRADAKRVLVIGEIDPALAPEDMLAADGILILMESDPVRAERARQAFLSSGLDRRVTVIRGEPRRMLHKLAGPFDVIVCNDADRALRDKLTALLAPGGVLITDETGGPSGRDRQ